MNRTLYYWVPRYPGSNPNQKGTTAMRTTGILSQTGKLNVLVVTVFHENKTVGIFPFTTQWSAEEARQEAIKLQTAADGNRFMAYRTQVVEFEVTDKDDIDQEPRSTHKAFVEEIHAAYAVLRHAIARRFGQEHGNHYSIYNGPLSIAQADLIENSHVVIGE
jgi:hypothetical protein